MGFVDKMGEAYVRKLVKKIPRRPKTIGYQHAQSIGLVYRIKDKDYQHFIHNFVAYLSKEVGFKNIQTIGYYNGKEIPSFIKSGTKYSVITKKDLKWNKTPKTDKINSFINDKYDILIDLTDQFIIPIKAVFVQSNAKLKIGVHQKQNTDFYDFMITLPENATLQAYINQINHYLNIIK